MQPENDTEDGFDPSWWAILGGIAVGVGAVAAAPFTGGGSVLAAGVALGSSLAGAGTVAAATGAGLAGAAAGAALSGSAKDQAHAEGHRQGVNEAKAEHAKQLEKMTLQLTTFCSDIKEQKEFFDAIRAMTAVGLSAANCDGEIQDEEKQSIALFIAGINNTNLPTWVKSDLDRMYKAPPNLRTAYHMAQDANIPDELIEQIIEVVIHADAAVHRDESAFLAAWHDLKSAPPTTNGRQT